MTSTGSREALWLAARDGASGALPDLDTGALVPVEELLAQLLPQLHPYADALGCTAALDRIWKVQQRPGHEQQRHIHALNGIPGLLNWLALETATSHTRQSLGSGDAARDRTALDGISS